MKKSTLISTLAMVVIVALALTTATFAWYTSNNSITATTTATAAIAGDADLEIKEKADGTYASTAAMTEAQNGIRPLSIFSPAALADSATFTNKAQVDGSLKGCFTYNDATGKALFKSGAANQYGVAYALNSNLYIHNRAGLGATVAMTVSVAVPEDATQTEAVTTALTNGLRVMVVRKDATGDGYTLCGIYGASAYSYTDNFDNNENDVEDTSTKSEPGALNTSASATTVQIGSIDANGTANLEVYIWYDGEVVSEAQAGGALTVTLTFEGTAAND